MNTEDNKKKGDNKKDGDNSNSELKDKIRQKFGQQKGQDKKPGGDPGRTIMFWIAIIGGVILLLMVFNDRIGLSPVKVPYSVFKELIKGDGSKIKSAEVIKKGLNDAELHGKVTDPDVLMSIPEIESSVTSPTDNFVVNLPYLDSEMLAMWDSAGFKYNFEEEKFGIGDILISGWPFILIILLWILMFRQMQGGGQKGIFSFGKSKAKVQNVQHPETTFGNVAGVKEAKEELKEIIDFLKDPQKFIKLGGKIPKGVLLLGPPGTGKTLLARAVSGEAGVPFLSISGSDFVEMFVGVGASRVRDLFQNAKKNAPSIIFIDEIDAVGRQRGAGVGGGHDEREQTLNQMLVEMDGFEENSGVILIAATNRPDVLDPALLRPGRFDRQIVVDIPDIKGREDILNIHAKGIPLDDDVSLAVIAKGTPGFVGADLRNIVNEASLMAARYNKDKVSMEDFEEAKDKVIMGTERKSMVLSEKEKKITAYHEAGHAICNLYCENADPLHKVTIIPRGRALGVTFSLPDEDKHNYTKDYLIDRVCISMGGRVAEDIVFEKISTGAANDIQVATDMVRKIVCEYGMTEELGPIKYGNGGDQVFLGREIAQHKDYSEKTAEAIDRIMKRIISEQYARSKAILQEHRDELENLANALLSHELLNISEVKKVIAGEELETTENSRKEASREEARKIAEKREAQKQETQKQEAQETQETQETQEKGTESSESGKSRDGENVSGEDITEKKGENNHTEESEDSTMPQPGKEPDDEKD